MTAPLPLQAETGTAEVASRPRRPEERTTPAGTIRLLGTLSIVLGAWRCNVPDAHFTLSDAAAPANGGWNGDGAPSADTSTRGGAATDSGAGLVDFADSHDLGGADASWVWGGAGLLEDGSITGRPDRGDPYEEASTGSGGTDNGAGGGSSQGASTGGGGSSGGGTIDKGGGSAAGGAIGKGGSSHVGGANAGGANAGGSGTGGTTVTYDCGLPPGPNNSVAEPTGTADSITVLAWASFKAAVTISLDDGNPSQIQNYDALNAMGIPLTFYLITNRASFSDAVWQQALADRHEIGNHTQDHSCGTVAEGATAIHNRFGVTAYSMAAPNGDTTCVPEAQQLGILINRGVSDGVISFTADDSSLAYNLNTLIPAAGAAASSLTSSIDAAYAVGGWKTFCIHGFTGDGNAYQPIPLASLTSAVATEKQKADLWFGTMTAVGAYWRGARAFAQASTSTSGTQKTWTWTLPNGFPPQKCLRVTTNGGTLTQDGQVLPWNGHGYYEVALDAGSVTLSP